MKNTRFYLVDNNGECYVESQSRDKMELLMSELKDRMTAEEVERLGLEIIEADV